MSKPRQTHQLVKAKNNSTKSSLELKVKKQTNKLPKGQEHASYR